MKRIFTVFPVLFMIFTPIFSQSLVWHEGIIQTNIDVRGNPVIMGQIAINAPSAGKVVVRFDGSCTASIGDRIILAASDHPDWSVNDGNLGVEAINDDLNRAPFSHTRVYDVNAGDHTFYAIAENFVETNGTGIASVYGSLTVAFFPNNSSILVEHQGIIQTNINVEGGPVAVGQVSLNIPTSGKVMVRFDGNCISDPGDRIILAASNTVGWVPNDGAVGVEAIDASLRRNAFSHTRVYDVTAGNQTFYAIAQNYVETDGNGMASIYGSLTVEFVPNSATEILQHEGIVQTNINVRGNPVTVSEVTINAPVAGTVVVNFDGSCIASAGDRIVLGASNTGDWGVNDGNVGVEVLDNDINAKSFSHSRAYEVSAGTHTFYAVAENYVETEGDGEASLYASLTARFSPNMITATNQPEAAVAAPIFYPNPTNGVVHLSGDKIPNARIIRVLDASGRVLQTMPTVAQEDRVTNLSGYQNGTYYFELLDEQWKVIATKKVVKTR